MDDYDFRKIDRETDRLMANFVERFKLGSSNNVFDRLYNVSLSDKESPPETILIPIGEYNGIDLSGIDIDDNYIVWMEVTNPEYGEIF